MTLIGYARVDAAGQEPDLDRQASELLAAGCVEVVRETGSGYPNTGPALAGILGRMAPGDVIVACSIDRVTSYYFQLLQVADFCADHGVALRFLLEHTDTGDPDGMYVTQVKAAGIARDAEPHATTPLAECHSQVMAWLEIAKGIRSRYEAAWKRSETIAAIAECERMQERRRRELADLTAEHPEIVNQELAAAMMGSFTRRLVELRAQLAALPPADDKTLVSTRP